VRSGLGKNGQELKNNNTVVSNKKKWTEMNPIWRRMKKCNPSNEQNGQLVHWWLLVHSGPRNHGNVTSTRWKLPATLSLLFFPFLFLLLSFSFLFISFHFFLI
jgi:hypothetical protein